GRRDAVVQPAESFRKRRRLARRRARGDLRLRSLDRLAQRGRLSAQQREIAVDALQLVPRGAGAPGRGLGDPICLGDGVARSLQLRRDPAAFALTHTPLPLVLPRRPGQLFIALKERSLLVGETDLVALSEQVRPLGLDADGAGLGERDARSRRLLFSDAGRVRRLARATSAVSRFFVDTRSPLAKARELRRQLRESGARSLPLRGDRHETRLESSHTLACRRVAGGGVGRRDATELLLGARRSQLLVASCSRGLAVRVLVIFVSITTPVLRRPCLTGLSLHVVRLVKMMRVILVVDAITKTVERVRGDLRAGEQVMQLAQPDTRTVGDVLGLAVADKP